MSKNFLVDVSCWLRYVKPLVPRFSGREVGPVVTSYIELGMSYGSKALLYFSYKLRLSKRPLMHGIVITLELTRECERAYETAPSCAAPTTTMSSESCSIFSVKVMTVSGCSTPIISQEVFYGSFPSHARSRFCSE